jgi:hypothetical protein
MMHFIAVSTLVINDRMDGEFFKLTLKFNFWSNFSFYFFMAIFYKEYLFSFIELEKCLMVHFFCRLQLFFHESILGFMNNFLLHVLLASEIS